MYSFVDLYRCEHSVERLCLGLGISRSGYYAWKTRKPGKRALSNQALLRAIVSLHEKYPVYGLDSIYHLLHHNYKCSRARVYRLMKQANIHSIRTKAFKVTTNSNHRFPAAPNLLQRNFNVTEPNRVWVSDITYVHTDEGWLYVAAIKDLCTKKIVGYAFSNRIDTSLTLEALHMALSRERPAPGLIHHSDRGVQYACSAYRDELLHFGCIPSMSRSGNPYDNAVAENFFSCLKCECVHLNHFASRSQASLAVFAYIEAFYNTVRPHSALGWISPNAFVRSLCKSTVA